MAPKSKLIQPTLPLFCYGTLLPGQPNHHLLAGAVRGQAAATLAGSVLYDLGEYPMLLEQGDAAVSGMVFQVAADHYQQVLAALDELEGYDPARPAASIYTREAREAVLSNGEAVPVWVYVGQPRFAAAGTPIAGGDWVSHAAAKAGSGPAWWQGIRSVRGLHS